MRFVVLAPLALVGFVACAKGVDAVDLGTVDAGEDVTSLPDGAVAPRDAGDSSVRTDAEPDAQPKPTGKSVVINELVTEGTEFVELYNPTSSEVDLTDWEIRYESGGGGAGGAGHNFSSGDSIASHAYLVLQGGSWTSGMSATDGQIGLFDGSGNGARRVDAVAYGSVTGGSFREGQSAPRPPPGGSIGRSPNGTDSNNNKADFKGFDTPTPGDPN